jgi:hypothetical protein
MPIQRLPRKPLLSLLRRHLSEDEDPHTVDLVERLRKARLRKHLTKGELERVCRWKSARAIHLIRANTHHSIRDASRAALASKSERIRLEELTALRGVSIPMASAILMLLNPKRYGVIDIRVWQVLHQVGDVHENPRGTNFTVAQWVTFLAIVRASAAELGVTARTVERTLFKIHQQYQVGRLYEA